jgi:bacterioferritin-associated ferredoxin
MYICVCNAVSESEVNAAIDAGARSIDAVSRLCQAGTECGSCYDAIEEQLEHRCPRSDGGRASPVASAA